jgi:hypothetical protein
MSAVFSRLSATKLDLVLAPAFAAKHRYGMALVGSPSTTGDDNNVALFSTATGLVPRRRIGTKHGSASATTMYILGVDNTVFDNTVFDNRGAQLDSAQPAIIDARISTPALLALAARPPNHVYKLVSPTVQK